MSKVCFVNGVTGGIGAYKAVEVCRGLQRHGHDVVAVMTRSAARFVGPVTFEAITRRPVITSQWKPGMNADVEHIAIADQIGLLLVAPCTANVIGKFAAGIADDFLSSLYLATRAPVLLAPAMNSNMLAHEAVQRNLRTLSARGVRFVEPGEGYLACGWIGKGRLAEPADIVAAALAVLAPADSMLRGRHVLVTAGPTYEDIDPVRYVGNRSSGRMGFALAAEARRRGARVTLVAGPTTVEPPAADDHLRLFFHDIVESAQIAARVTHEIPSQDDKIRRELLHTLSHAQEPVRRNGWSVVQVRNERDAVPVKLGGEAMQGKRDLRGLERDPVPAKEWRSEALRHPSQRDLDESFENGRPSLPRGRVAPRMQEDSVHCAAQTTRASAAVRRRGVRILPRRGISGG